MAPRFYYKAGRLFVEDVGRYEGGNVLGIYFRDSMRMGFLNDIRASNIGRGGKIFDPAYGPLQKAVTAVAVEGLADVPKFTVRTYDELYLEEPVVITPQRKPNLRALTNAEFEEVTTIPQFSNSVPVTFGVLPISPTEPLFILGGSMETSIGWIHPDGTFQAKPDLIPRLPLPLPKPDTIIPLDN